MHSFMQKNCKLKIRCHVSCKTHEAVTIALVSFNYIEEVDLLSLKNRL